VAPQPGDPRLIVAKPASGQSALDGYAYLQVPGKWDNAQGVFLVDTAPLAKWLGKSAAGLPEFEHIRDALQAMGVKARYDLTHLQDASDPRVYVFTE
jgi:hypothetical protein